MRPYLQSIGTATAVRIPRQRRWRSPARWLAAATLSVAATAQPYAAGYRDDAFANPTGQGTASLSCRVYYPAASAGRDAPLLPRAGGHPVLVFLHGFTALGSWYGPLGEGLAQAGYVAVMSNTAQFSAPTQVLDGLALYPALQTANAQAGFFQGALDLTRAGLCGHSMGGGSTLQVLARNPGYRLGVAWAGVDAAAAAAALSVPVLFVHGLGDAIVNVSATDNNFAACANYTGLKAAYVFDAAGTHTNVAGLTLLTATDQAVFARASSVARGFCDRYLRDSDGGLDALFGAAALAEPRLARASTAVQAAELWRDVAARIGTTVRLGVAGEPGPALLLVAAATAAVNTPFGVLRLDPASLLVLAAPNLTAARTAQVPLAIPSDSALVGARVPFQVAAAVRDSGLRLGRALSLELLP